MTVPTVSLDNKLGIVGSIVGSIFWQNMAHIFSGIANGIDHRPLPVEEETGASVDYPDKLAWKSALAIYG